MNCQRAEELFSEYYDRGLEDAERGQVEEHLRSCVPCGQEYRHFKKSLDLLRTSSQFETSTIFAPGVVAQARSETTPVPVATPPSTTTTAAKKPFPWFWVPVMAAIVVFAFLGGLIIQRPQAQERIREVPVYRDGPERVVEKPLTTVQKERILREEFGLVQDGKLWLPKAMKEGFEKGFVCFDGEMLTRDEAFARLSEGRPKIPPPDLKAEVDKEMDRLGYQRVGKMYVPRDWLENWSKGSIQTGPNSWMTRDEFRADFMKEHNLVEFPEKSGIIISREHRDEILAARVVRRPDNATADNEVTSWIAGLELGPPSTYKNLTLYPILSSREAKEAEFITLSRALEDGKFEIADEGNPFSVRATNAGERPVLLCEGEVLVGGRWARIVLEDTLVGKKPVSVPVVCVEPGATRKDEKFAAESGHYFGAYSLRRILLGDAGQGAAWANLLRQIELTGGKAKSQSEVYHQLLVELMEFRTYFADIPERFPDAVGVVIAIGENVEVAELFLNRAVFESYFDRVINAAALQAGLRTRGKPARVSKIPSSLAGARQTIEAAFFAKYEKIGDTRLLRTDGRASGRAFLVGDRPAHLTLFAETTAGDPDWRVDLKVPPDKLKKVLDDVDRRAREGAPVHRARAIYELSLFCVKEATARLVGLLGEPDGALKREVIAGLGRRQDPRAVPAILDVLDKSKRDLPTHAAAAAALARIGDERAVEPLLKQFEGDAGMVRSVLTVLPELLLQVKSVEPLEKSVGRLILLLEETEAIVKGVLTPSHWPAGEAAGIQTATRAALEGLTGENFETAARAREWWNKRENREAFLKERTGK